MNTYRYTNTKPALRGNSKDLDNCRVTQKDTKYKTIEKKLLKESIPKDMRGGDQCRAIK